MEVLAVAVAAVMRVQQSLLVEVQLEILAVMRRAKLVVMAELTLAVAAVAAEMMLLRGLVALAS
jgi:hypothetical protein